MKLLSFILFSILVFSFVQNLERTLYLNEILSALGVASFLVYLIDSISKKRIARSDALTLAFACYLTCRAVYSILFELDTESPYLVGRTSVAVYSFFAVFLGWFVAIHLNYFIESLTLKTKAPLFFSALFFDGRLSNQFSIPFSTSKRAPLVGLISMTLIFAAVKGGATSFTLAGLTLISIAALRYKHFRYFYHPLTTTFYLVGLITILLYINTLFGDFYYLGFSIFNGEQDVNAIWRLMYWSYLTHETFTSNILFGSGIGNALFDPNRPESWFITNASPEDPDLPYVHGPHNSFIFFLFRFGIIGMLGLSILISISIYKFLSNRNQKSPTELTVFFLIIFSINSMLFNVFLETPLYAATFWFFFGVFQRITNKEYINLKWS